MGGLLLRRLAQGITVVFLVASLTFALVHLAPGDPLSAVGPNRPRTAEQMEQLRRNMRLDRPLPEQYAGYMLGVVRGDLGTSFLENRPVWHAIRDRIPATALLALAAILIDYTVGILFGVFQGSRAKSRMDDALTVVTLTLYSVPVFWFGMILVLIFALQLGWFPALGATDPVTYQSLPPLGKIVNRLHHLVLPAVALGLVGAAATARFQRVAILDVIHQDYIRTARSKGLPENVVLRRHTLRNALLPVITLFGLSFPVLLSGAVLVEPVFGWPGMGQFAAKAATARDYPAVTGVAIVASIMVVVGNMLADVLYRVIDPRTRPVS